MSVYEEENEIACEVPLAEALAAVVREIDRREGETDFEFQIEIEVRD